MALGSPVLSEEKFIVAREQVIDQENVMTVEGTIWRAGFLITIVIAAALWPWQVFFAQYNPESTVPQTFNSINHLPIFLFGGMIAGFILALIISFKPKTASYLSVPYAFCEGVFLGALSATFEMQFPGIVIQAAAGTFGVLMVMLALYSLGIIKATEKFRAVVISATTGIVLLYLVLFVLRLFGVGGGLTSQIFGNGVIGIGFSIFVCVIAALNLIMDFDLIERGAKNRAPKYMAWFSAFALLVTLVWLYIEILRLLSKVRSRN